MNYDFYNYYKLKMPRDTYTKKGLSGLMNHGNTCYLNSAVQCLAGTLGFTDYLLSQEYLQDTPKAKRDGNFYVVSSYINLLVKMFESNDIYKPRSLKQNMGQINRRYHTVDQQDSHEFFLTLLDCLHEGLSYNVNVNISGVSKTFTDKLLLDSYKAIQSNYESKYSKVSELFDGQYYTETRCNKCDYKNYVFDSFRDVSVELPKGTLYENLDNMFSVSEPVGWKCEKCGGSGQKDFKLWSLGNYLVIHLKRFDSDCRKVQKSIDYPLDNLELTKYISPNKNSQDRYIYKLYAVNCHTGSGISSGHYYSVVNNMDGNWYMFNDSDTTLVSDTFGVRDSAYMLFYYRKFISKPKVV